MTSQKLKMLSIGFASLVCSFPSSATAQKSPSSAYERFVLEACPVKSKTERSTQFRCSFKKGPPLLIDYHEHGVDLVPDPAYFGHTGERDPNKFDVSRSGHFGDLVTNSKKQATIEWRVELVKGKWKPFAAIYRTSYNEVTPSGDNRTRYRLDIMKFGADHACQIGVVDANLANHNTKARQIADLAMDKNPCAKN